MGKFNSNNLKALIARSGLSVERVAEATGVKKESIKNYIHQGTTLPLNALVALADYFAVPLDFIVGRCDEETAHEVLKDYGRHFMELRRAPFEAYLMGRNPEQGTTYGDGKSEAPWPYNLYDAVLYRHQDDKIKSTVIDNVGEDDLMAVLDTLSPRMELGIIAYYRDGMTLEEISKLPEFQLHRERVRQIIAKGLRLLRHPSRVKILRYGRALVEQESEIRRKEEELKIAGLELARYEHGLNAWEAVLEARAQRLTEQSSATEADEYLGDKVAKLPPAYRMRIDEMGLGARSYNVLTRAKMKTVGEVAQCIRDEQLLLLRNCGKLTAREIINKVAELTGEDYRRLYPQVF